MSTLQTPEGRERHRALEQLSRSRRELRMFMRRLVFLLVAVVALIVLGTVAFILAMAHRNWQLHGNDDVQDDVEDAAIRKLALDDAPSESYGLSTRGQDEDTAEEEVPS